MCGMTGEDPHSLTAIRHRWRVQHPTGTPEAAAGVPERAERLPALQTCLGILPGCGAAGPLASGGSEGKPPSRPLLKEHRGERGRLGGEAGGRGGGGAGENEATMGQGCFHVPLAPTAPATTVFIALSSVCQILVIVCAVQKFNG